MVVYSSSPLFFYATTQYAVEYRLRWFFWSFSADWFILSFLNKDSVMLTSLTAWHSRSTARPDRVQTGSGDVISLSVTNALM